MQNITRPYKDKLKRLERILADDLEIKDLETLIYFLGTQFARSKGGIIDSRQKYVLDLLSETSLLRCKEAETPIELDQIFQLAKPEEVNDTE